MKRHTITIIELVIVLCVIFVAVRVWTYKKPEGEVTPIYFPFFMVKNDLFFGKKKSIRILYQIRFSMKIERNICPVSPEIPTNVISPVIIVR